MMQESRKVTRSFSWRDGAVQLVCKGMDGRWRSGIRRHGYGSS
jgi:hypothetical protein